MFLGLGLRYQGLGDMSFDHDEMGLVAKSRGIFSLGFPYTIVRGRGPVDDDLRGSALPFGAFWLALRLFGVVHAPPGLSHGNDLHWRDRA